MFLGAISCHFIPVCYWQPVDYKALQYLCEGIKVQVELHGVSEHEQQALMDCSVQSWTGLSSAATPQVRSPTPGAWWQDPWADPKAFAYVFQSQSWVISLDRSSWQYHLVCPALCFSAWSVAAALPGFPTALFLWINITMILFGDGTWVTALQTQPLLQLDYSQQEQPVSGQSPSIRKAQQGMGRTKRKAAY